MTEIKTDLHTADCICSTGLSEVDIQYYDFKCPECNCGHRIAMPKHLVEYRSAFKEMKKRFCEAVNYNAELSQEVRDLKDTIFKIGQLTGV